MNYAALTYDQYMANQSYYRIWLMKGIKRCPLQLAEVEYSIRDGERLPIVLLNRDMPIGLMICELSEDALHITSLAGRLPKGWKNSMREVMTTLARDRGRKKITATGRKGWPRYLKDFDIIVKDDLIEMEID